MPGPAPKRPENRARTNATFAMTQLPAGGRTGRAPKWPLGSDTKLETEIGLLKLGMKDTEEEIRWLSTARERSAARRRLERQKKKVRELEALRSAASKIERTIWSALWKTPQATQWEKRGWYREVALFARHQAKGESGSLDDAKEARMRENLIGLNDMSMLRLRWEIGAPTESGSGRTTAAKKASGSRARRAHLKLVEPPKKK